MKYGYARISTIDQNANMQLKTLKRAILIVWKLRQGLCAVLAWSVAVSAVSAQQLNPQQIQIIKDTAASICNTVKETRGQKSNVQDSSRR
jgi:hypothetical protein